MSESLRDKVAIVGAGCCQFGENWDKSADDMIIDAVYEAYDDAGLGREDIQGADVSSRVGAGVGGDGPEVGVGGVDGGSADAKNATPPPPKRGWWGTRRSRDTDRPPDEKL